MVQCDYSKFITYIQFKQLQLYIFLEILKIRTFYKKCKIRPQLYQLKKCTEKSKNINLENFMIFK